MVWNISVILDGGEVGSFTELFLEEGLGMEPRTLCLLSTCSTAELHPSRPTSFLVAFVITFAMSTKMECPTMGAENENKPTQQY